MLLTSLILVWVVSIGSAKDVLPLPERAYNVLMMLPCSTRNHIDMFMPIAKALANRGHKITIVDNMPTNVEFKNIDMVHHNIQRFDTEKNDFFSIGNSYFQHVTYTPYNLYKFTEEFYNTPQIKKLYKEKDKFDVVFVDHFNNEVSYPLAFGKPFISMVTTGQDQLHSASIGNVLNPAYVSYTTSLDNLALSMSLFSRAYNFIMSVVTPMACYFFLTLPVQIQISKLFPELPSLTAIERNQSLAFINSHFSLFEQQRLLPAQIEVGGIHCRPGKPLTKKLNEFISGDKAVVYVSFGSDLSAKFIPENVKKIFASVFSQLPCKILWQFDEIVPNISENVLVVDSVPQQDVLAHPNVKLFISHGPMMDIQESVYHETPILGLPLRSDQRKNAYQLRNIGIGQFLEWSEFNESLFLEKILEVLNNKTYSQRVSKLAEMYTDQPDTPLERAVYWTEYAVRFKGAHHLRSPELDVTWLEFFSLDVLAAFIVVLYITTKVLKLLFKYVFRKVSNKK